MTDLATQSHEEMLRRLSIIAIALALLLLLATPIWLLTRAQSTTAAFADAEVLEKNRLGAATLDIEVGDGSTTFEASNLAPGDFVSGQLELINAGTLPLIYEVSGASDGDLLADWLRFELWFSSSICSADDPANRLTENVTFEPSLGSNNTSSTGRDTVARGRLDIGQRSVLCLGARLLLDAPNAVQGRRTEVDIVIDAVHDIELDQARESS